jgi:hypothetical protein
MKIEELGIVIEIAKKQTKLIMEKYPKLSGYPVFSLPSGQCDLKSELDYILMNFPNMIQNSDYKASACLLKYNITKLETEKKKLNTKGDSTDVLSGKIKKTVADLNQFADKLDIIDDTFIELRFKTPILEDIFRLQKDPLVSQIHTLQTTASVRIVLGTIGELYSNHLQRTERQ